MAINEKAAGGCRSCTMYLMQRCYERKWWFPLLREPLLLGMRLLARWHGIKARDYVAKNPDCSGCIRFTKRALLEQSPLFVKLHGIIGPHFKALAQSASTEQEREHAKKRAKQHMS
ncbi:nitroreductase [Vibrio sp. CAIM 722]|uniref:Nitroreductase n=1 Tax=Vibrio eleionomae TaxID=2653505 RepID=A0A7X4RVG9_9VIBR|nr:nitroreductase [Vibrio eleionomae]MZI94270.1 nitroreductase [Vibrio eleionomae]